MEIERVIKFKESGDCKIIHDGGKETFSNVNLPADTWIRQRMHEFINLNGYETEIETIPVKEISDVQFFAELARRNIITANSAILSNAAVIPPELQTLIDQLPDANTRFYATMLIGGARTFHRDHPLTNTIGAAFGYSSEQIDDFFEDAATFL